MNNTYQNKGFKMALPFIAGVAAGALAVIAWNRKDELKEKACEGFQKSKEFAMQSYEKGKEQVQKTLKPKEDEPKDTKKPAKSRAKKTATKTKKTEIASAQTDK